VVLRGVISHDIGAGSFEKAFDQLIAKARQLGDTPLSNVSERLGILEQLAHFELGRALIKDRGMSGFWTKYVCTFPQRLLQDPTIISAIPALELFLLRDRPLARATQERFQIFRRQIQSALHDGIQIASVPCGLMEDLLSLDYQGVSGFSLHGFDLDQESLDHARRIAEQRSLGGSCRFSLRDAWDLDVSGRFDLISSSGLNIYVNEPDAVEALYRGFCRALKPGGQLVASFMTPPPWRDPESPWNMTAIISADLRLQRIIYQEILGFKASCYRSEAETIAQLKAAGFIRADVIWDSARMFPTVVAARGHAG
jgi:SAM-dependent methyltransferase